MRKFLLLAAASAAGVASGQGVKARGDEYDGYREARREAADGVPVVLIVGKDTPAPHAYIAKYRCPSLTWTPDGVYDVFLLDGDVKMRLRPKAVPPAPLLLRPFQLLQPGCVGSR